MADFRAGEVLEIGMQIERNGAAFYTALAARGADAGAAKLFRVLARQEEEHLRVFAEMQRAVADYAPAAAYPDEYFAYLRAQAAGIAFALPGRGAALAATVADDRAAIDLALAGERQSADFYRAMKKVVPPGDLAMLDRLIAEEETHIAQLTELRGAEKRGGQQ